MHHEFNLQDVKDRNVIDSSGDNVGTVVDVVIDPTTWRVSHFLVALRRDLEPEITGRQPALFETRRGHLFEIAAERIRTVGDNVVLNVALASILERLRSGEPHASGDPYAQRAEADRLRYGRRDLTPAGIATPPMGSQGPTDDGLPPMP